MLMSSEQGSFLVQILDRQHESWQGVITWLADGRKKNFKSLLEFITIVENEMNSKLSETDSILSVINEGALPVRCDSNKKESAGGKLHGHSGAADPEKMLMKTG